MEGNFNGTLCQKSRRSTTKLYLKARAECVPKHFFAALLQQRLTRHHWDLLDVGDEV
jgi:hypothetical protein